MKRLARFLGYVTCRRRHVSQYRAPYQVHVELDCPGPSSNNAVVKVNGKQLPLVALTLELRAGEINRAILEVEPDDLEVVVGAVPVLRKVVEETPPVAEAG